MAPSRGNPSAWCSIHWWLVGLLASLHLLGMVREEGRETPSMFVAQRHPQTSAIVIPSQLHSRKLGKANVPMVIREAQRYDEGKREHPLDQSREVTMMAVSQNGNALAAATEELKGDQEVVMQAVSQTGWALQFASEELRGEKAIVMKAVSQDGFALQHATQKLQADREIVMRAVSQDGNALQFAADTLRGDYEIVMQAVLQDGFALQHATEEMREDARIVMQAVSAHSSSLRPGSLYGSPLCFAAKVLTGNPEIVMTAVSRCGTALMYAAKELRGDPAIVMTAVSQDGNALQYATKELRGDPAIVMTAVSQDWWAIRFATEKLTADRSIVMKAISQDGRAFNWASKELRGDWMVFQTAVTDGRTLGLRVELLSGAHCFLVVGIGLQVPSLLIDFCMTSLALPIGTVGLTWMKGASELEDEDLLQLPAGKVHQITLLLSKLRLCP